MSNAIKYEERDEIIDGVVYAMSPQAGFFHTKVNLNIRDCVNEYVKGSRCEVVNETLSMYKDKDSAIKGTEYVNPDVILFCDIENMVDGKYYGVPGFIVETLSESTEKKDREIKMKLYANKGISEYWIVNWKEDWKESRKEKKFIEVYYLVEGVYRLERKYDYTEETYGTVLALRSNNRIEVRMRDVFNGIV